MQAQLFKRVLRLAGVAVLSSVAPLWAGHAPTPGGPPPSNPPPSPPPGCGQNPDDCCDQGCGGKPVDFWNGREFLTHTDLVVPGLVDITIRRSYDSQATFDSALGFGWALGYFTQLYEFTDGSVILRRDCGVRRPFLNVAGAYQTPVGENGTLVKEAAGGWTYTERNGERKLFDQQGRLAAIVSPSGPHLVFQYDQLGKLPLIGVSPYATDSTPKTVALNYRLLRIEERDRNGTPTGHFVTFAYDDTTGRLETVSDNSARTISYSHDGLGNLVDVALPGGASLAYAYEDPRDPHNATTLSDSPCASCAGGAYLNTYDAQDRVVRQERGMHALVITYDQPFVQTTVTEEIRDETSGALVSSATTVWTFNGLGNPLSVIDPDGSKTVYNRDSLMNVVREERWENTPSGLALRDVELFSYDARGNLLTDTVAAGTAEARVTEYTYDAQGRRASVSLPSVVDPARRKVTRFEYDAGGNLVRRIEEGLLDGGVPFSYVTTFGYDANGQLVSMDGPRTDVADVVTWTYEQGRLVSVHEPLGLIVRRGDYGAAGEPATITDANGVVTSYVHDEVGRVLSATRGGGTTGFQYTPSGDLRVITPPRGNAVTYHYDALNRVVAKENALGEKVHYAYDAAERLLAEEIRDAAGVLRRRSTFEYDLLGRIRRAVHADGTYSEWTYDWRGDVVTSRDARGNVTTYEYDGFRRRRRIVAPGNVITTLAYDAHDSLTSYTAANGVVTHYFYDDMGRLYREESPDSGTTVNTYDAAGNRVSRTDGRGVMVRYEYDALNRLTRVDHPTEPDVVYVYDTCPNGKGRLCTVQDQAGVTSYAYDALGRRVQESRTIAGRTDVLGYAYDGNWNLERLTYPSGRTVSYAYDAADRVTGVVTAAGGTSQNLASGVVHIPWGGSSSLTYGNGLTRSVGYDADYRMASVSTPGTEDLLYEWDGNGNLTRLTNRRDATKSRQFGYDARNRLVSADGSWGSLSWSYDGAGNRLSQGGGQSQTYAYAPGTNRLVDVTGGAGAHFDFDNGGNVVAGDGNVYTYGEANRLSSATGPSGAATYAYDARARRVTKSVAGDTTVFLYDSSGLLLAENEADGDLKAEYVYLDGRPLAVIQDGTMRYVHTDHLGAPALMTDGGGASTWAIEAGPFGWPATVTGTATLNLRLPGQYFDAETGLHQNWHRHYAPALGRYTQADPIGVWGGPSSYAYALDNPVNLIDRLGLQAMGTQADRWTYGEIRQWAITNQGDFTPPAGLADAKASINAVCSRGESCVPDQPNSGSAPGDQAAWNNITNANGGTDMTGGGTFMCVGTQQCTVVQRCWRCVGQGRNRRRQLGRRQPPLAPTGQVTVNGRTIYFYDDPLQGWCNAADRASGCRPCRGRGCR
jgi:RHS repeat-associated protein